LPQIDIKPYLKVATMRLSKGFEDEKGTPLAQVGPVRRCGTASCHAVGASIPPPSCERQAADDHCEIRIGCCSLTLQVVADQALHSN
jgi:hypothetical protein